MNSVNNCDFRENFSFLILIISIWYLQKKCTYINLNTKMLYAELLLVISLCLTINSARNKIKSNLSVVILPPADRSKAQQDDSRAETKRIAWRWARGTENGTDRRRQRESEARMTPGDIKSSSFLRFRFRLL